MEEEREAMEERLQHLESYSEKLTEMLERNQAADDSIREKFVDEINNYKNLVADRDAQIEEMGRKVEILNVNVREKVTYII